MKFSPTHYEALKNAIATADIDLTESKKAYAEKGLSDQRYYWDIFWASKYNMNEDFRNSDYLDTHIETAVKAAVKELTNKH